MADNTIIIGDSYSTFKGYIPEGYAFYYSEVEKNGTGVTKVEETWWDLLRKEADLNVVLNNSWSGSTIGYRGYNNSDTSASSSFIYRLRKLINDGFFNENKIDKVFVFGGTNDSWCGAPLGEIKYENCSEEDFYFVLPAVCYFLKLIRETLPKSEIYCLINTGIKAEIANTLKEASEKYGIIPITFDSISKDDGHPNICGMQDIKNTVLKALK